MRNFSLRLFRVDLFDQGLKLHVVKFARCIIIGLKEELLEIVSPPLVHLAVLIQGKAHELHSRQWNVNHTL